MDIFLLLSKVLSFGIIVGAVVVKLPQIIKIGGSKSAKGLVVSSVWLETVGLTINFAYSYNSGFAFSTYGETVFILVQNVVILYMIYLYSRRMGTEFYIPIAVFGIFAFVLISGFLDIKTLAYLQGLTIPLFSISKIPQILKNYQSKGVGQLSFITTFLQFAGSAARVFTSFKEVNDNLILLGFVSGTALNGILTAQCALYKDDSSTPTPRKRVATGKKN
eukprot:Phypoly_transcript_16914.p1 GENE.Phypoly_transcript_16914~~Phypoly_transcript_16914.p1  ORF type:complete len:220 (+),score=28.31 Phypoly_transcript_16914:73-732(+)